MNAYISFNLLQLNLNVFLASWRCAGRSTGILSGFLPTYIQLVKKLPEYLGKSRNMSSTTFPGISGAPSPPAPTYLQRSLIFITSAPVGHGHACSTGWVCCRVVPHTSSLRRCHMLQGTWASNTSRNSCSSELGFRNFIGNINQLYILFRLTRTAATEIIGKAGMGERKLGKEAEKSEHFAFFIFFYFPPANYVFTAHSVILTILKASRASRDSARTQ